MAREMHSPREPHPLSKPLSSSEGGMNFIERIVAKELKQWPEKALKTRFPPEPNGFLHLGHAKSLALNFGLAEKYGGQCNLRMDDTNPSREEAVYVQSIQEDVRWLGYRWSALCHASDYFEIFYEAALTLIRKGLAYVDHSTPEAIARMRGTLKEPGICSEDRNRSISENLEAFEQMRHGGYAEGGAVLRAKINMASGNLTLRDPILYRIKFAAHPHRGQDWVIYPMYDFAHCISDAVEGITHSLCTLEFQDNRALYDWILDHLDFQNRPRQYEFSKLQVQGMVLSKRKLTEVVTSGKVSGWDDPRMPTLAGLRRKGVPPEAIRLFCSRLGISKQDNAYVEAEVFEAAIREVLNLQAPRAFAVTLPLKLVLINLEAAKTLQVPRHPQKESLGQRSLVLERELWISREDFQECPEPGFKRLALGRVVRLRYGPVIRLLDRRLSASGEVEELLAEVDLESIGQSTSVLGRPQSVIHWLSQAHCLEAELICYRPLFKLVHQEGGGMEFNPASCTIHRGYVCQVAFKEMEASENKMAYQFEREGYFYYEPAKERPKFHRTATLKQGCA